MTYRKFTIHIVVGSADAESISKELNTVLEKLKENHTVYTAEYSHQEVTGPENPDEIRAPAVEVSTGEASPGEESSDDEYDKG